MALYSELPVYKATYDLFLGIFQFTKNFGKEYKYTLANRTKGNFFNAIEKQKKVVRDQADSMVYVDLWKVANAKERSFIN